MRPLCAHRWPLLAVGGAMVVLGLLLSWAMFLQSGAMLGREALLKAGPTTEVVVRVTQVDYPRSFEGRTWDYVHYEFEHLLPGAPAPSRLSGTCFVPTGSLAVGQAANAAVLDADANVHCIDGGVLHMHRPWLYAPFWLANVVIPGGLILLAWLAGVSQLFRVLVHGDVSVATVRDVREVRWVLPPMLSVAYEFRDHRAVQRKNRHWVRVNGVLGRRLLEHLQRHHERPLSLPVVHDRRFPQWNRLLLAQDFLPSPQRPTPVEQP
ncbi:MAG: hypothetical protein H6835_04130 [Planctomycetes bacterium]|nr:hypothetical protein [Planctomycetota bacterium]